MPAPKARPRPKPDRARERLQKTLARAGYGSRRSTEQLIREGRVEVGGRVASLGDRVDPLTDAVAVDGIPIPAHPDLRYLALNKPEGVTTTLSDRHAKRSLAELLPPGPRVFPVGRLDRDSEGLLLLMNDGELAHRIQHPRFGIEKEYLVQTEGNLTRKAARQLLDGVELEDGIARALAVRDIVIERTRSSVRVIMAEGRKREVRRMMAAIGHPALRLVRTRIGPVKLSGLAPGETRRLAPAEVSALYELTGLRQAGKRKVQAKPDPPPG